MFLHTHTIERGGRIMNATEEKTTKETYVSPVLTKHEILRDITAASSGSGGTTGPIETTICRLFPRLPRCN